MKKLIFIVLISLNTTYSQETETITTIDQEWAAYSQNIDVSKFEGYEFRASATLKMENAKANSNAALWVRIDKKDNEKGFFQNNFYTEKATSEWKTFEIKGKIGSNADKFYIGAFANSYGDFYFDEFKLEVKSKNGKWQLLSIDNSGFETKKIKEDAWSDGISKNKLVKIKNFTTEYTSKEAFKGKHSLVISCKNILGNNDIGKTVEVNGVKLYYEIYGEGEPLLLLHGNGQSIYAFNNQVEEYSKYYKVIILDCRGRGNSGYQDDVELTFDVEIEDLKQFLDKINIDKTHIVGWSDGGILGILMAIKYPEKVDKMVSMAGNIFPDGLVNKEELMDYVKQLEALNVNNKYDKFIDFLNLDYKYPNLKFEELNVIKSKCLIMAGDRDEIKTEHTVKIFEAIPNAQLAIVPNATHYLPSENPKLFNEIVLRFLGDK